MPCLKIFTNIPKSAIPKDFLKKIVPVLSKCVNKPADKFLVAISTDCLLSVNGKEEEPSIISSLESIGNLGPEQNKIIAKVITEFLCNELNMDRDSIFLSFYDIEPHNIAKNGKIIQG